MARWNNKTVYLIQSTQNGYVHVVFETLQAARIWLNLYESKTDINRHPYQIIDRELFTSPDDIQP